MQTLLPRIVTRLGSQTVKFLERIHLVQPPRILLKVSQATPLRQLALSKTTIMRTLNLSKKIPLVTVTLSEAVSRQALTLLPTRTPLARVVSAAASVRAAAKTRSVWQILNQPRPVQSWRGQGRLLLQWAPRLIQSASARRNSPQTPPPSLRNLWRRNPVTVSATFSPGPRWNLTREKRRRRKRRSLASSIWHLHWKAIKRSLRQLTRRRRTPSMTRALMRYECFSDLFSLLTTILLQFQIKMAAEMSVRADEDRRRKLQLQEEADLAYAIALSKAEAASLKQQ